MDFTSKMTCTYFYFLSALDETAGHMQNKFGLLAMDSRTVDLEINLKKRLMGIDCKINRVTKQQKETIMKNIEKKNRSKT